MQRKGKGERGGGGGGAGERGRLWRHRRARSVSTPSSNHSIFSPQRPSASREGGRKRGKRREKTGRVREELGASIDVALNVADYIFLPSIPLLSDRTRKKRGKGKGKKKERE